MIVLIGIVVALLPQMIGQDVTLSGFWAFYVVYVLSPLPNSLASILKESVFRHAPNVRSLFVSAGTEAASDFGVCSWTSLR
jgi:hypothetical protein